MTKQTLINFYHFIGKRPAQYGVAGLGVAFILFGFDLALATMLQRFFMATGLVTLGLDMPLGIPLQTPVIEAAILICIGILRGFTIWGNSFLSGLCQVAVEVEKRNELTAWSIADGKQEVGHIMSYFNDIILGAAASVGGIFYVLSRLVIIAGLALVMLHYSVVMTFIVLGFIIIIAPLQFVVDRVISRNSRKIQSSLAYSVSLLARNLKNNLFVSLHNLTEQEVARVQFAVNDYGRASMHYYSLSSLRSVVPQVMGLIAVVVIAIYGHGYFDQNPGLLVAYLYLVLRFFQVLSDIARVSGNLRLNYPRISLLFTWWMNHKNKTSRHVYTPSSHHQDLIGWRGDHVGFVWPNGHDTSIQDLNFDIRAGTTSLIVGASGTGKTTLFQILLGLLSPTCGSVVTVDQNGKISPIKGLIPQVISYVGPDPFLIAGSIRDQLLVGNQSLTDDEIISALRLVHADFVFDFIDGLNHQLTEQGAGLSAGQKQRLALARAILRKPSVLLLDEATANLDSQTEGFIIRLINSLRGQMTILVISHRPHSDLIIDTLIDLKAPERKNP